MIINIYFQFKICPKLPEKITEHLLTQDTHPYLYWTCEPWTSGPPLPAPCVLPSVSLANSSPALPSSASCLLSGHPSLQLPRPAYTVHCHFGPWHSSLLSLSYHFVTVLANTFQSHQSLRHFLVLLSAHLRTTALASSCPSRITVTLSPFPLQRAITNSSWPALGAA